jgi:hypothetical protein
MHHSPRLESPTTGNRRIPEGFGIWKSRIRLAVRFAGNLKSTALGNFCRAG